MMFHEDVNICLGEWCLTEGAHVPEMTWIFGTNSPNFKLRLGLFTKCRRY
jgi:hypothetical protein